MAESARESATKLAAQATTNMTAMQTNIQQRVKQPALASGVRRITNSWKTWLFIDRSGRFPAGHFPVLEERSLQALEEQNAHGYMSQRDRVLAPEPRKQDLDCPQETRPIPRRAEADRRGTPPLPGRPTRS
jgi:hypothetical protein